MPDVIVIGGGVIGSAIAYFLVAETGADVLVLEADPDLGSGSTGLSVGGFRRQFSVPENIAMADFSFEFLARADHDLAVDDTPIDLSMVRGGYLFLATAAGRTTLCENHALQTSMGAAIDFLEPGQLADRFPWMVTDDLAAGTLGRDEGWLDPHSLRAAFAAKAKHMGARFETGRVVGLERDGARIRAAITADGRRLSCGALVDAAGARAREIAAMAGLALPVSPRKRCVFQVVPETMITGCPLLIDPSGVYLRPEGQTFLCGVSPAAENDPDTFDLSVDEGLFEAVIWPVLAERIPAFESIRRGRAWAGLYAVNTLDRNAILGPHPAVDNFYFACGFSGHGLQQSPAVGKVIAEWIAEGAPSTIPVRRLGYGRITEGEPLAERNII